MNKVQLPQVDAEELTSSLDPKNEHEARWLQDHNLLDKDHPMYNQPVIFHLADGTKVSNDPNEAARQQLEGSGAIADMVEARAKELAEQMVAEQMALQNYSAGVGGEFHGNATNSPPLPDQGLVRPRKPDVAPPSTDVVEEEAPPYHEWSNKDLQDELTVRELDTHGTKKEMADRLEEHDKSKEGDEKED